MIRLLALLLSTLLTAETCFAQSDSASDLGNAIRDFNSAFGDVVDGEMTEAQIQQFETMIAPMFDPDEQHKGFCGLLAFASITMAGNIAYMSQPSLAATYADMLDSMRAEVVPGSLFDELVQFGVPLILPLGVDRTREAANAICLSQPMAHAAYKDLPIGSPEMAEAENCLLNHVCPDND